MGRAPEITVTYNMRSSIGRMKRCKVPSCRTTSTPQWGHGPDGPYTLCSRCYNKYRNRQVDLYQDVRTKNLSVVPSRTSYQVRHVGFRRRGGAGLRMNISRPIVEDFRSTSRNFQQERPRPVAAVPENNRRITNSNKKPGGPRQCAVEHCTRAAKENGPDGVATLCKLCFMRYAERKMVLYQDPFGLVSVVRRPGCRKVKVANFVEGEDGKIDGCRPIVELCHKDANSGSRTVPVREEIAGRQGSVKRMRNDERQQGRQTNSQRSLLKRPRTGAAQSTLSTSKVTRHVGTRDGQVKAAGGNRQEDRNNPVQGKTTNWNRREGNRFAQGRGPGESLSESKKRLVSDAQVERAKPTHSLTSGQPARKGGRSVAIRYRALDGVLILNSISFYKVRKDLCQMCGLSEHNIRISYLDEEYRRTWIRRDEDVEEFLDVIGLAENRRVVLDVEDVDDRAWTGRRYGDNSGKHMSDIRKARDINSVPPTCHPPQPWQPGRPGRTSHSTHT
eukprot:GFKZ01014059.1.p1 GENE.GFKZ01014059.1~~GFKZ01014059.1.p1  ORF type:complete len:502 (+),score=33.95 GFKZ01014059.1:229-1734(+)